MSKPVLITADAGLVRITLSRPDAGNAVTPATIAALAEAITLAEQAGTRAVLIDAQGRNFCVGADLRHFQANTTPLPYQLDAMAIDFHAMLLRLASLPIPVVAAVQGNAIGAGLGLVLASDVVIATPDSRLATGYIKLGLSADAGVSWFLTRALGSRLARSLLISGRTVTASQAEAFGLIDLIVEDSTLTAVALAQVQALAAGPLQAFAAIKRLVGEADGGAALAQHLDRERSEIVALARTDFAAAAIEGMLKR